MPKVAHHFQQHPAGHGSPGGQVVLPLQGSFPRGSIGPISTCRPDRSGFSPRGRTPFRTHSAGASSCRQGPPSGHAVVDPVFQMVLVAALVPSVQPRGGIALRQTFRFVGAVVTLIIDAARNELRFFGGRAVLAQVVWARPCDDRARRQSRYFISSPAASPRSRTIFSSFPAGHG